MRRALRRHPRRLGTAAVLLSLHQACEALVPVAIGLTIDRAVATGSLPALAACLGGTAVLFLVLSQAYRFGARAVVAAWYRESHQLRVELAGRVLDPHGLRGAPATGELLSIATSDAERTGRVLEAAAVLVAGTTALVVSAVSLLLVSVPLGIGVLVGTPMLVGALQLLAPLLTRRTAAQQADVARTAALATDLVQGVRVLRGIRAEDAATERYRRTSATALRSTLRAAGAVGAYRGATVLGSGLFLAAVAGVAGALALRGDLTVGELVTVVGLAQFLAEPVGLLGFAGQKVAEARASAARIAGVLALPAAHEAGQVPRPGPAELHLRDVRAGSLAGATLHVPPGELLGVVAPDPRDAESLVALLAGRLPANEGSVLLDGVDTRALAPGHVRRAVLVEPHAVVLFEGTVRAALDPAAERDDAAVLAALEAAAATDVVVPAGLGLPVGERGRSLSGGQRQRVGLARALLRDPAVLVLHDPTTAVDAVTEEAVAAGLVAVRHDRARLCRSTVLVTSSPALLGRCDRVVVLTGGRVTATGTHAELTGRADYAAAVLR
ncbi:ATP-binding cassette domain-containing protein [Modestobacter sp. I12A-02628]|uniref:ABC transporter ATP-binding protein n=1 Tax=Goekera deserti TaxID=2497753 RepID=A0A7K3WCC4_9ACTN|nr:ATP-binding cassette domain-containing protein [Goekera deserti]NDI49624.1 ATP-binding cassette domain-containing protein [Goekera deserti]NEL53183.1 ABC transporter ATP-binding protein [Goekera deserti]